MKINWKEPLEHFYEHFDYYCQLPPYAQINSEEDFKTFCNLVDKCISDNFDYTIEECGTIVPEHLDYFLPDIIDD